MLGGNIEYSRDMNRFCDDAKIWVVPKYVTLPEKRNKVTTRR
jgi:hypothetical protein